MPGAILKGGQDTTRARKSPENKCEGFLHGSLSRVGKITLPIHPDNPHLTTFTQHVMVGITRSKVILGVLKVRCDVFFPTCQVRVVRFYVSLFSFSSSRFLLLLSRYCEFSVACRAPTAILRVQCGVPDPNCDLVSSVWRAGPQLRSCEFSVACRTPTAIMRVQCGVPDPNRELVSSVWRAGPQPRSCEFSVASRTPTAIL